MPQPKSGWKAAIVGLFLMAFAASAALLGTAELLQRFSLGGVSRTNAVFDRAKLEWFNTQYLQTLPIDELLPFVEAELKRAAATGTTGAAQPATGN